MKFRRFALIVGLAGVLLGGVITVAYAFTLTSNEPKTQKSPNQKNDVVFNWGLSG